MPGNWVNWVSAFMDRTQPSLEAQLVDVADAIAYNNHDVDDGLRSVSSAWTSCKRPRSSGNIPKTVRTALSGLPLRRLIHETVRRMMNAFITDLIAESQKRLGEAAPGES